MSYHKLRHNKQTPSSCTLPFLRWPGGKRWLTPTIAELVKPSCINRYFEPFLGGGAIFFHTGFGNAHLSDINPELINVYVQVRDNVDSLVEGLKKISVDRMTFEKLRCQTGGDDIQRAIRFLFLNRTAFSGLYRLNSLGRFNVPYGGGHRTPESLWKRKLLQRASLALQKAALACSDFEDVLSNARPGDLAYCDPTYTVAHDSNGFRRYNEKNFSWRDQERLARVCRDLADRGVSLLISNAYHEEVAALYGGFHHCTVERRSSLCPKPHCRGMASEYLFYANLERLTTAASPSPK